MHCTNTEKSFPKCMASQQRNSACNFVTLGSKEKPSRPEKKSGCKPGPRADEAGFVSSSLDSRTLLFVSAWRCPNSRGGRGVGAGWGIGGTTQTLPTFDLEILCFCSFHTHFRKAMGGCVSICTTNVSFGAGFRERGLTPPPPSLV